MLIFKNNRLHAGNISFTLPENCQIVSHSGSYDTEAGIMFQPADESFLVVVEKEYSELSVKETLMELVSIHNEVSIYSEESLEEVTLGGCQGYSALYRDKTEQAYDICLPMEDTEISPDGESFNILHITLTIITEKDKAAKRDIQSAMKDPVFVEFLDSIEAV